MSCIINTYKDWSKTQLDKGATKLQLDQTWLDALREKRSPERVNMLNRLVAANRGSMEFAVAYNNVNKTVGNRLVDVDVRGDLIDVYMENGKYTFKKGEVKSQPLEDSKVKYLYMPAMEVTGDKMMASESNDEVRKGQKAVAKEKINSRVEINKLKERLESIDKIGTSPEHKKRLEKVLNMLVNPVLKNIPDMEIYLDELAESNGGAIFVDEKEIRLGVGTRDRLYGTDMSMLEKLVHELGHASTHYAMQHRAGEIGKQITTLRKFRQQVMKDIKPEDLLNDVVLDRDAELEIAKARIEYMNNPETGLEEFLMYALTNEAMIKHISTKTLKDEELGGKDWFDKMLKAIQSMIEFAMAKVGKPANRTLKGDVLIMKLVGEIAAVNNKIEQEDSRLTKALESINNLDDKFADWVEGLQGKNAEYVKKYIAPKLSEKKKLSMVEKVRLINFVLGNTDGQPILEGLLKALGLHPVGLIQTLVRHLKRADEYGNKMQELTMASGQVDSDRQNTSTSINEMIASTFKHKMSKMQKKALYGVFHLGDGAHIIKELKNYKDVIADDTKLQAEIDKYDNILKSNSTAKEYNMLAYQAKGLADLMRTGKGSIIQRRNVQAITQYVGNTDPQVVKAVDMLSSLYALQGLDASVKEQMSEVIAKDPEGVENMANLMVATREYIRSKQTPEQNLNMMKNYHRETYDDYVTSKVAKLSEEAEMKAKGYVRKEILPETGLGFEGERLALYVSRDMIRQPFNRSAMRYVGDKQSGLLLFEVALKGNNTTAIGSILKAQKENGEVKAQVLKNAIENGKPLPKAETNVIPELNENGEVIDYRTTVTVKNKIKHLGLETNPMEVVGRTWGHEVDVEQSEGLIETVWEELMKDAAENAVPGQKIGLNKYAYTRVSVNNPVYEVSDVANILPPSIKKKLNRLRKLETAIRTKNEKSLNYMINKGEIEETSPDVYRITEKVYREVVGEKVWDNLSRAKKSRMTKVLRNGEFMVREDMILDAFGARDMSLGDWKKFPKQVKTVLKKIENVWKEIVKIFKVDIVIRLLPVIMGNIVSNLMYSVQTGHSPLEVAKLQLDAVRELKLYIQNKKEISVLIAKLAANPKNSAIKNKIDRLKNDIKGSSIYPLIKAGMYQHIVEDVGLDDFKSNSRFMNWIDDKTESWPEFAKVGLHWAYVSEKTSLFQMVTKATAYSDFAARYAQHTLMKRKMIKKAGPNITAKQMKEIEDKLAVEIRDAFVNYSQPDSRVMQYMNDIGLIMFTKYMVRIQKVIQDGVSKHPLRFALALMGQELLDSTIGWEPDDIAEKTMYGRGIDNMFYTPGFTGIVGNIIEPQVYTYLEDALKSVK